MNRKLDIVLINPGDRRQVYQDLGQDYSGIEPPFWVAVMAAFLRNQGLGVAIIDANAENIAPAETASRVRELDPHLAAVIVYGSNPSASTQNMTIAGRICRAIKEESDIPVAMGGLHPSALPARTFTEERVDFVIEGEGPLTLWSDSDKVMQIASNLLGNAARYTDRGRITLILGRHQDHLTFMVTDTGRGMREADVKRITSRMNDRARRRNSVPPSCDKGLVRTSSLVELLGGSISLASRWEEGTIVEVRLPLGPGRAERAPGREFTTGTAYEQRNSPV